MKFLISRTSDTYGVSEKPCEGAVPRTMGLKDKDVVPYTAKWEIDIRTLRDLLDLVKKVGDIIVSNGDYPNIEIYDSYRE